MFARVESFVLRGIDAAPCEIEADLYTARTPGTTVVGLPDAAVRESLKRVQTAIGNSGYEYPRARVTVNLAPASLRKEGPVYDLPIAVAVLAAAGVIVPGATDAPRLSDLSIAGELALDGRVRPVRGVVSLAMLASQRDRCVVVPHANASEASIATRTSVLAVRTLKQLIDVLNGHEPASIYPRTDVERLLRAAPAPIDFGDVRGQETAKRALTIAAAGSHNCLMIGPAGTGKTMMARALVGILPPLTPAEALEVTRVYSAVGQLGETQPLIVQRPVRSPHHTASAAAVIGGGTIPRPGEVSLAHRGVLFLDEMPEFARDVLETLREPLEEGEVTISRRHASACFPARFMLLGALNPTARGESRARMMGDREVERYIGRLSRPLVDRIDLHIEVPAVGWRQLTSVRRGTDTDTMRQRVADARARQTRRQGPRLNGELSSRELNRHARLNDASLRLLEQATTEIGLSARAYDKIRRVALTIADLESSPAIEVAHVAEAIQYRLLDRLFATPV